MSLVGPVRDRVRTLLKIRVERHTPAVGSKPAIGSRIFCGDLRMTVQAGMSDGLWRWLVSEGWREITFRPDRRRYRDLPATYVTHLIDCSSEQRSRVLEAAIANAVWRPVFDRRGTWANSRGRQALMPVAPLITGAGRRYSEFRVGDTFGASFTITEAHLDRGAELIGDFNPLHVDPVFAQASKFGGRILHGVLTSALMSAPFGNLVSGTALGYLEHNARFLAPVRPGDTLTVTWTVMELIAKPRHDGGIVVAECVALNQDDVPVATATGKMLVSDSASTS